MRARVHTVGVTRTVAWSASLAATAAVLAILTGSMRHDVTYGAFAMAVALGCLSTLLVWRPRPRTRRITLGPGLIRVGYARIDAASVTGFAIVPGARGASVAITRGTRTVILAVDHEGQAARIASALLRASRREGTLCFEQPAPLPTIAQRVLALLGPLLAMLYWSSATNNDASYGKAVFGIGMLATGLVALATLAWRTRRAGHIVVDADGTTTLWNAALRTATVRDGARKTVFDAATRTTDTRASDEQGAVTHANIALAAGGARLALRGTRDGARTDDHVIAQLAAAIGLDAPDAAAQREADVAALCAGSGDDARGWLARLDAWAREAGGASYRGTLPARDELWRTLRDGRVRVDARVAAGRLLRVGYGEDGAAVARAVDDAAVRVRVSAGLADDADDAATALERLAPVGFRARTARVATE